jgi:RHS repeat-associated protein
MKYHFFSAGVAWVGLALWLPMAAAHGAVDQSVQSNGNGTRSVRPNRTLPAVQPPTTRLEFSSHPTAQEIMRARVFEEPLVSIGGEPSDEENAALASALLRYSKRSGPDDFASLTGFLEKHPNTSWRAALLTDMGLEYYNTAHYSLALGVWEKAWELAKDAVDGKGKAIADRAVGELAALYSRLGRITELETLLTSVKSRTFVGSATEKVSGARESLWSMQHRPEIAFKCGPYALQRILAVHQSLSEPALVNARAEIANAASTPKGLSLPQVAELTRKVGLDYQMAFREKQGRFIVPSVVHWKVGHYAAMVRQEGDRYLVEDPTFGNTLWVTRETLEAETSGYFLVPPGQLSQGWRGVEAGEGGLIWGKGQPPDIDPKPDAPNDPKPNSCKSGPGMAVSTVHLSLVSLNINDEPVGYSPPVGPGVRFTVRYNQREAFQPANFTYSNFGPKWTCDWISYITDNPQSPSGNVNQYVGGGGTREFTGFANASQSFAFQQYDQTLLKRIGPGSYEMTSADGSKLIFGQPDGSVGTSRKIFLTQLIDPFGNAVTLTYDANLRIIAISDAIGQVTTLAYGWTNDIYKITRVTDPFNRFAEFAYDSLGRLTNITDVIGLNSRFVYQGSGDFVSQLITPYGTNTFTANQGGGFQNTTRSLETVYADGSRDRVEYNQSDNLIAASEPKALVPSGMAVNNVFLQGRNTYYWSRTACASSYGDYTKAKIYHWLHAENIGVAAGILESTKEALENRVWYNYDGQNGILGAGGVGTSSRPTKVGRVLDDGQTQLYTYTYDGFGHVTNSIDPVGRTFSYLYASNGIDLLEVRQTRAGNNELLFRANYNAQHLPLTKVGADGQTNTFVYNSRGQLLTNTNAKAESTSYIYDTNGYLIAVDGPLPGTNDTVRATYDALGRRLTKTDESGYTLTFEHDDMDRLVKITHPDLSFEQFIYNRLDVTNVVDRAGRQTIIEFDNVRQMKKKTDPLLRTTFFEWCRCGAIKSLTDPMGRTTTWITDVQSRTIAKVYGDGSQVQYFYENASSRLRQVIDEKQQISQFTYNLDDTLKSTTYANATVPTSAVSYHYDPNYQRQLSMTDGTGTTLYSYNPITSPPTLGANQLASVDGPLPNDTITYEYDALGRRVSTAIDGVATKMDYDAAGRVISETNALGAFTYAYDGASGRLLTNTFPNGMTVERGYGGNLEDRELQRITHRVGGTPISEFLYGRDRLADRITTWSQQAGAASPDLHTFGYDDANQLLSDTVTNAGIRINSFAYAYDALGNRLSEQVEASNYTATYNALNQINTTSAPGASHTNEWDAKDRLVAVNQGNQRTEFTYDGLDRMVSIRQLTNSVLASFRRLFWCDNKICEERDFVGTVTKRFFEQGMKLELGPNTGSYYYTRDHLSSVRELIDHLGSVRIRQSYDPFGRRSKLLGDLETDADFAGFLFTDKARLLIARFRIYDPELGRWLTRDPLDNAEVQEGANLYSYVRNDPVNYVDPLGLNRCCIIEDVIARNLWQAGSDACDQARSAADTACAPKPYNGLSGGPYRGWECEQAKAHARSLCGQEAKQQFLTAFREYENCLKKPCRQSCNP